MDQNPINYGAAPIPEQPNNKTKIAIFAGVVVALFAVTCGLLFALLNKKEDDKLTPPEPEPEPVAVVDPTPAISSELALQRFKETFFFEKRVFGGEQSIDTYSAIATAVMNLDDDLVPYCGTLDDAPEVSFDKLNESLHLRAARELTLTAENMKEALDFVDPENGLYRLEDVLIAFTDNGIKLSGPCDGMRIHGPASRYQFSVVSFEGSTLMVRIGFPNIGCKIDASDGGGVVMCSDSVTSLYKDYELTQLVAEGLHKVDLEVFDMSKFDTYRIEFDTTDGNPTYKSISKVEEVLE